MEAKYIYRIDDITEDMNWDSFNKHIEIFKKYGVVPLIGVVPKNRDKELKYGQANKNYWTIIREFQKQGIVEIAQHGYTHVLDSVGEGILKSKYGYKKISEFAGLSYEKQYERISEGKKILEDKGIKVDTFMAPSHTFDDVTIEVLNDLNFEYITDGVGITPYKVKNVLLVPQQFGKPRSFITGVITICLHINKSIEKDLLCLEDHIIKHKKNIIKFSMAKHFEERKFLNILFGKSYMILRSIKAEFEYDY
jgi:predicted deacetylase